MTEIKKVHPSDLKINPNNSRTFDPDHEDNTRLRQSIKVSGVLTPIQAYSDNVVFDGNSRLQNIMYLSEEEGIDIGEVDVIYIERPEDELKEIIRQLNINQARQIPITDQAVAFAKLSAAGMTNTQIADLTPFSLMHVGNVLTLAKAPEEIKEAVKEKKISATLAIETLRGYGKERAASIIKDAIQISVSANKGKATKVHLEAAEVKQQMLNGFPKQEAAKPEAAKPEIDENEHLEHDKEEPTNPEEDISESLTTPTQSKIQEQNVVKPQRDTTVKADTTKSDTTKTQTGPSVKQLKELINEFIAPANQFINASEGEDGEAFFNEAYAFVETLNDFKAKLRDYGVC